ncbi:MAG TPA: energy transducer TonB [Allosphingosinicella sp.]|nr:energy transducer TonB [Allosphingosinicella sp.]
MARMLFFAALLVGAATPALADTPADVKARNAQSWDVLFSEYPPRALAAGQQGLVGYKVKLDRDGYATECEVIRPSGHAVLDEETCRLILNRATFKGMRDSNGRRVATVAEGDVNWVLPSRAASYSGRPAAAPAGLRIVDAPAQPSGKRVCKRHLKTGTLATYERICMTEVEWARHRERNQAEWGELQGSKGSSRSN